MTMEYLWSELGDTILYAITMIAVHKFAKLVAAPIARKLRQRKQLRTAENKEA